MKILSSNMCSLGGRAKNISLKRLVDLDKPNVIFIKELMGPCTPIIVKLAKMFLGWKFSRE